MLVNLKMFYSLFVLKRTEKDKKTFLLGNLEVLVQ